jgi:mono/diheme cytochrome c family protein
MAVGWLSLKANMKAEWIARLMVVFTVGAVVAGVGVSWLLRPQTPLLHARMAETGGWTPESLKAVVGQPLQLRLTSDDVMHSFAIGQSDQPPVDVKPGEISEVTLTFDRPGKYTFYCTRWCSINHWRMRGVIEVTGPAADAEKEDPPLYVKLGLDIDTDHRADVPLPRGKPSAVAGEKLGQEIPPGLLTRDYYLVHTPAEAFKTLKATPGLGELPDQDIWNLVAKIWDANITSQALENGRQLYATNCAACHGEQGRGDGVFAAELAQPASGEHTGMEKGEMTQQPVDFTDAAQMLSASSAHLQGKIIRGGMGTGMPYWGPIFTEEQTWDLVAFLWSFQFDLEDKE